MKLLDRKWPVYSLLAASLLLNAAALGYLAKSGGLQRLLLKADLVEQSVNREPFQKDLEARYRKLPNTPAEVDFVGDSLIGDGPWAELFSEVHNRGIGGDTTAGVLSRLDEVLEGKPRKVILLVGTNDLATAVPDSQYLRHYRTILERIRTESPGTAITSLAILPINPGFPTHFSYDNARVVGTNRQLKALVAEFPGVRFLDLAPLLADDAGNLRREFTADGMHLNLDGYLAIREALKGPVAEEGSRH
jgi:lysophospholipase L1-like esterase